MPHVFKGKLLSLLVTASFLGCFAPGAEAHDELGIPEGWRLLNDNELAVESEIRGQCEWDKCRTAHGDWNGDGRVDGAGLLVREDGSEAGLWVFFYRDDATWDWMLVREFPDIEQVLDMGLESGKAGVYKLPCFEEYNCPAGAEYKEVTFKNEVINVYSFEISAHYLVWNDDARKFDEYWFSD